MCAQDGDLQGEARASFESARAELMSLENGTREPTQTAWESARQTAQAEVGVVVWAQHDPAIQIIQDIFF